MFISRWHQKNNKSLHCSVANLVGWNLDWKKTTKLRTIDVWRKQRFGHKRLTRISIRCRWEQAIIKMTNIFRRPVSSCFFHNIRTSLPHMGVSKNRGTPKSSILIGFSLINHPFGGTPIFGNTHIVIWQHTHPVAATLFLPLQTFVLLEDRTNPWCKNVMAGCALNGRPWNWWLEEDPFLFWGFGS